MASDRLEALRAAVLKAFAGVPPPRTDYADLYTRENLHYAGKQRLGNDNSTNWSQISDELIEANCTELALLSAEADHYYLPAFLLYAIDHWKNSEVWDWTLIHLTRVPHKNDRASRDERNRARLGCFTPAQIQTVFDFLDLVLANTQDWINWTDADRGKKYLMELLGETQRTK
jgi:hypothetical protein